MITTHQDIQHERAKHLGYIIGTLSSIVEYKDSLSKEEVLKYIDKLLKKDKKLDKLIDDFLNNN